MGNCGHSSSSSEATSWRNTGSTGSSVKTFPDAMWSRLSGIIDRPTSISGAGGTESDLPDAKLAELLSLDPTINTQHGDVLDRIVNMDPTSFVGSDALQAIAGINPYSSVYKDEMEAFFTRAFEEAAAAGRTGPDAVRGGNVHGAMVEADMLEKAALNKFNTIADLQMRQAGVTSDAARTSNAINVSQLEQKLAGLGMSLNDLYTRFGVVQGAANSAINLENTRSSGTAALAAALGGESWKQDENMFGKGYEDTSGTQRSAGSGQCCFIFLEACNGKLPWFVRVTRDLMGTKKMKSGYTRMSRWLVPLMQRSKVAKAVVNMVMVQPLLKYGAWMFRTKEAKASWRLYNPVRVFWFNVWTLIGEA